MGVAPCFRNIDAWEWTPCGRVIYAVDITARVPYYLISRSTTQPTHFKQESYKRPSTQTTACIIPVSASVIALSPHITFA